MVNITLPANSGRNPKTISIDTGLRTLSSTLVQEDINAFPTMNVNTFLERIRLGGTTASTNVIKRLTDLLGDLNSGDVNQQGTLSTGDEATLKTNFLDFYGTVGADGSLTPASQLTHVNGVKDGLNTMYGGGRFSRTSDSAVASQAKLEEAKARYEAIKDPEQKVGYYEGWFPIFRPMKESSLFGVFGAGLFLLLLSIFIFLNMNGVSVSVQLPQTGGLELPDFSAAGPWAVGGLVIGGLGTYLVYKYL